MTHAEALTLRAGDEVHSANVGGLVSIDDFEGNRLVWSIVEVLTSPPTHKELSFRLKLKSKPLAMAVIGGGILLECQFRHFQLPS